MARTIIGAAFISLDGVVQAPGGPTEDPTGGFDQGGWVFKVWDEGVEETLGGLFGREYDLLLGRRTYDIFAAYWPYVEGEEAGMGEAFTKANKYVLSHGGGPLEWENTHRMAGIEDVAALKQGEGPDIIIQGSSTIYPALLAAGLIDRLTLMTYPVIIGKGKRLFGDGTRDRNAAADRTPRDRQGHRHRHLRARRRAAALSGRRARRRAPARAKLERQRRMAEGTW